MQNAVLTLSFLTVRLSLPLVNGCSCLTFSLENSELIACAASNEKHASKYKLAREVIIRHLKSNLKKSHPDIDVRSFTSINSVEFDEYLRIVNVYFVMCHNGTLVANRGNPKMLSESCLLLIKGFMDRRYNVALINEIEWRDSKVRISQPPTATNGSFSFSINKKFF